ncbi:patatin-domain-containing protein [Choiromyces venosus 120613-1]|uniref:Patatin-like phospholipase domain-containing protein n=1 Tax=Choiromyces venosus 120613-1 TaxID=1336337 RepID=A0A3N4JG41_9PEZI|nr:patatin-domain-containing protein [Choiromyces venosus 120613-1]
MSFIPSRTHSTSDDIPTSTSGSIITPILKVLRDPSSLLLPAFVLDEHTKRHQLASARLKNATTYADWHGAAKELDVLEGNEAWKSEIESPDYDYALVAARLKQLDEARISCDVNRMLFLIRTTLSRNLGDMENIRLYKHSHTGTKRLIEEYINSCVLTLNALLTIPPTPGAPSSREILDSLLNTRQAFGRTALLLSGGATFGMNHVGVLKALLEQSLLPRIISGASAGSIVAAVLCTRTDNEIPTILEEFPYGNLDVFEDGKKPESVLQRVTRFLKIGAWIDIKHLTRVMRELLGDITFQEAYNRTRRILNICVSSASIYELPRLLNYVSAPNVLIWSAVAASCSVPFLFTSTSLLAKDPQTGLPTPWDPSPQRWIDGSVDNDLPMPRLSEMFNVNHFIVSQVNPHVVPFLTKDPPSSPIFPPTPEPTSTWRTKILALAHSETLHRLNILSELGIFPTSMTKLRAVLSQKYSGDINIFPETPYADLPRMLKNPTTEFVQAAMERGERATWPCLTRVRNHVLVELELDRVIHVLRARVVFEPSRGASSGTGAGAGAGMCSGGRGTSVMRSPRGFGAAGAVFAPFTAAGVNARASSSNSSNGGGGGGGGRKTPRRRHQSTGTADVRFRFTSHHQHQHQHHRRANTTTATLPNAPVDYFTIQPEHSSASTDEEDLLDGGGGGEGEAGEPVANSARKRFTAVWGGSGLVISMPSATSAGDSGRTLSSRRGRELVRMTRVAGEFDGGRGVKVGIGRAKSAEELRGFRG